MAAGHGFASCHGVSCGWQHRCSMPLTLEESNNDGKDTVTQTPDV